MEFGKLENIDEIDWVLAPDSTTNRQFLQTLPKRNTDWFLGTPTWGSSTWVNKIYPSKTPAKDFLFHYSRAFNSIELNTTFYRLPETALIKSWTEKVPAHFKFCPKFPKDISHEMAGLVDTRLRQEWIRALSDFGENLGVTWLQLSPHFDYSQKTILFRFLESWPKELPLALELRHPSWFAHRQVLPALVDYLRKKSIGLVITDVAGRRDVLHASISAPFVLVRFIGNDLHPSDYSRAEEWCQRLKTWSQSGLQSVYFFAHEPDDIMCPEITEFLVKLFNREVDARWPDPWHQSRPPMQLI